MTTQTTAGCPGDRTVNQTSYRLLCDALRETVHAGSDAVEGAGSIRYRASAVLYMLLLDHPVDRRGRCRSCRRSGAVIGLRRRPCRVHVRASYWLLRQPDDTLLSYVANEVEQGSAQTPAVPFSLPPREFRESERPEPHHGGTGEHSPTVPGPAVFHSMVTTIPPRRVAGDHRRHAVAAVTDHVNAAALAQEATRAASMAASGQHCAFPSCRTRHAIVGGLLRSLPGHHRAT